MNESVNSQNVERLERLLLLTEQMQEELDQKDRMLEELKAQNEELQSLNERLNKENNSGKLQALENDLQRVNGFLKSEREKAQRTESILEAYQDKEWQAERMQKQALARQERRTAHYRAAAYLLGWYAATTTLFTAILSPVFLADCKIFFCTLGKGIWSVGKQFLQWADYAGRKGRGIIDGSFSEAVYWIMTGLVFICLLAGTGVLLGALGYQIGKVYRKYCWDIISIMVAIMSTAIAIYFGEWIKSVIPLNLIAPLLLVHVVYIGIRCYMKDWLENRGC